MALQGGGVILLIIRIVTGCAGFRRGFNPCALCQRRSAPPCATRITGQAAHCSPVLLLTTLPPGVPAIPTLAPSIEIALRQHFMRCSCGRP